MSSDHAAPPAVHPLAHLGPAPYRFVGLETTEDRQALNAYRRANGHVYTTNMCGGACDHCGTAIWNVYRFEAADGAKFKLGSDCMRKAGIPARLITEAKREQAKRAKVKRDAKRAQRDADARARMERRVTACAAHLAANRDAVAAQPHPHDGLAAAGKTLADYCDWVLARPSLGAVQRMAEALGVAVD